MAAKSAVVEIVDTVAAHGHRDTKDGKLVATSLSKLSSCKTVGTQGQ